MNSASETLESFGGIARLFPLPNLVLFPHVVQPLHIFEPRYREMMADALDDDKLIALALLRPGWEEDYHKRPPVHPIICLGRIVHHEKMVDGRYNLMLTGLSRARIVEEMSEGKSYRQARVELCSDCPVGNSERSKNLRKELGASVLPFFSAEPASVDQLKRLLDSELSLGALDDIFSFALPLEVQVKQRLLETLCVETRNRLLLEAIRELPAPAKASEAKRKFPPDFSPN